MPAASYHKDRGVLTDTTLTVDSFANTNYFGAMPSRPPAENINNLESENASLYLEKPYTENYENIDELKKVALGNEFRMDESQPIFKAFSNPTSDKNVYENNYGNGQVVYKALERESGWRVVDLDSTPVSAISGYEKYPVCSTFRDNNFTCTTTTSEFEKMDTKLYQQKLEKSSNERLSSEMLRSFGDSNSISSLRKYFESEPSNEKLPNEPKNLSNFGLNEHETYLRAEQSNKSFRQPATDRLNDSETKYNTKMSFLNEQTSYVHAPTMGNNKSINWSSKRNKSVRLATIESLGDKIRKLREDMKELRSTTTDFQDYMGRMFNELSVINQISWKAQWVTGDSSTSQTSQSAKTVAIESLPNPEENVITNAAPCHQSNFLYLHDQSGGNSDNTSSKNTSISSFDRSIDLKSVNIDKIGPKYVNKIDSSPNIVEPSAKDYTEKNRPEIEQKVQHSNNLRLIPILNHRHKALHTSECSIDSGYQDSAWHSPRQSRELASQVVTPASHINEYPDQMESSPDDIKQEVDERCVQYEKSYTEPIKYHGENNSITASNNVFQDNLVKEQFSVAKPRLRSDSYHSVISSDSSKLERPIPKQRTKFIVIEQEDSIPEINNYQSNESIFHNKNTAEFGSSDEICNGSENSFSTEINQHLCPNQKSKQAINAVFVQKPTKLGANAINPKPTKDPIRKIESTSTKSNNSKQRLREKVSDVMKRSAATNAAQSAEDNELESSQFRRRSMRMMTEFQIFDIKEAVVNLNHAFSVANKCDTLSNPNNISPKKPQKIIMTDPVTPQNCNEVIHTYENVELIRQEPKGIDQNKQIGLPMAYSEDINQKSHDDIHAKHYERAQRRPPTPQKHQQEIERSLSESQSSIVAEIEKDKQGPTVQQFHHNKPVLLRPKAELPGYGDLKYTNISTVQQNNLIGLKISPSERSAFTPVLSSSMRCLHQQNPSSITERYDVPYSEIEPPRHEYKQTSLPLSAVRNKRNFIKELAESISTNPIPIPVVNTSAPEYPNYRELSSYNENGRLSIEDSVISTEHSVVTSFKMSSDKLKADSVTSSNPHLAYSAGIEHDRRRNKSSERRRNIYVEPKNMNMKQGLENVPSLTDFPRGELKEQKPKNNSRIKIIQGTEHQNTQPLRQSGEPAIQPFAKYGAFLQDPLLSVRGRKSKGQRSSFRSNIPLQEQRQHQQPEVRHSQKELRHHVLAEMNSKDKDRNPPMFERSVHITQQRNESNADAKKSSRKSTVALIRASFIGKKDKSVMNPKPDSKQDCVSKSKPRSSSLTSKKNVSATPQVARNSKQSTSSVGAVTKKEIKPKSIPHFGKKSKQDDIAKKTTKESKSKSKSGKDQDPILLPESSQRRHGNADSEIMDRFLRSEPPPNSNVRSHLQKLRSSFRTPRNKAKILAETRYKDDMAMGNPSAAAKSMFGIRPDKKSKLRQDAFTYV